MNLHVVHDEPWPIKPCIVISEEDGEITIDTGTLDRTEARALISTAFVALCAPPSVKEERE